MVKTIYKYDLGDAYFPNIREISLPVGSEILTAQMQNSQPKLWVRLDTQAEKVKRKFTLVGTGWNIESETLRYIATVQEITRQAFSTESNSLVWHVFEDISV